MFDETRDVLDDFFGGGGGPAGVKFQTQNQWVVGTVYKLEVKDQIDLQTQKPKLDERSGKPKQMLVAHMITDLRDPEIEGDEGDRRQFFSGNMLWELREALKAIGARKPQVGCKIATAWTGSKKSNCPQPQKLYTARYMEPTSETLALVAAKLEQENRAQYMADPFSNATPAVPAAQAQRVTLDSMRSSDPFGDEPPF